MIHIIAHWSKHLTLWLHNANYWKGQFSLKIFEYHSVIETIIRTVPSNNIGNEDLSRHQYNYFNAQDHPLLTNDVVRDNTGGTMEE